MYQEVDSLELLSDAVWQQWRTIMAGQEQDAPPPAANTNFLCYGPADVDAIRTTVRLACLHRRETTTWLTSPMQFVVQDVTRSGWFRALGFESHEGTTPSLVGALEKAAQRNEEAALLLQRHDAHNPLWDAQALSCIVRCWV